MKLTKNQLKAIIKEEVEKFLEADDPGMEYTVRSKLRHTLGHPELSPAEDRAAEEQERARRARSARLDAKVAAKAAADPNWGESASRERARQELEFGFGRFADNDNDEDKARRRLATQRASEAIALNDLLRKMTPEELAMYRKASFPVRKKLIAQVKQRVETDYRKKQQKDSGMMGKLKSFFKEELDSAIAADSGGTSPRGQLPLKAGAWNSQ